MPRQWHAPSAKKSAWTKPSYSKPAKVSVPAWAVWNAPAALTGAVLLAGFKNSDGDTENPSTKASTYQYTKKMVADFKEKCGSTSCKELKGIETGKVLHSCPDCIMDSVEIVQEVLGL